jgi:hypothetical protein
MKGFMMSDNTYTWDAVPEDIYSDRALESVQPKIIETLQEILENKEYTGVAAMAAHVYERKGFYSFSDLSAEERGGRNLDNEDVILQVTVRVHAHKVKELSAFAKSEGDRVREEARQAENADIELQIAQLRARQAQL